MTTIEAALPRGVCPIEVFGEVAARARPVVILFMDGFGPRPVLRALAERLSGEGYRVMLPHLFTTVCRSLRFSRPSVQRRRGRARAADEPVSIH